VNLPATNIAWPEGKRFAFTIFDDPDSQTPEASRAVYGCLRELGFRTTKGVWPAAAVREASDYGATCGDPDYLAFCLELQAAGFEIGYHNATSHTSTREETIAGLARFEQTFGQYPITMAQHYFCDENIYWGDQRVSGPVRWAYNLSTRFRNRNKSFGHKPGHPLYWGDVCGQKVRYLRNFVFAEVNTLRACPFFPYHDPERPMVNYWFCSSEGSNVKSFLNTLREEQQDRLEAEGGLCVMYAHFGHGFYDGALHARFRQLMERLARKNGWFVPAGAVLDWLRVRNGEHVITAAERGALERKWLLHKLRYGTT
jgi:hypothetical protein